MIHYARQIKLSPNDILVRYWKELNLIVIVNFKKNINTWLNNNTFFCPNNNNNNNTNTFFNIDQNYIPKDEFICPLVYILSFLKVFLGS